MPTSGDVTLELTFADAAKSAAVELGVIGTADDLEDSEREEMQRRANSMLKTWSVEANLFREETATVTITGGTGAATLPAEVREINSLRHIVSATNNRQLARLNRDEFYGYPNRATVGNPSIFYVNKGPEALELRIWPVPADDIDLDMDYSRGAYAITAPEETLDIPTEWQEAFILGLASRCASMFGTTRIDPQTVAMVTGRAEALYSRLLDADRPDSYYFEPWGGQCCG
jgi:hypothetical protein